MNEAAALRLDILHHVVDLWPGRTPDEHIALADRVIRLVEGGLPAEPAQADAPPSPRRPGLPDQVAPLVAGGMDAAGIAKMLDLPRANIEAAISMARRDGLLVSVAQ